MVDIQYEFQMWCRHFCVQYLTMTSEADPHVTLSRTHLQRFRSRAKASRSKRAQRLGNNCSGIRARKIVTFKENVQKFETGTYATVGNSCIVGHPRLAVFNTAEHISADSRIMHVSSNWH